MQKSWKNAYFSHRKFDMLLRVPRKSQEKQPGHQVPHTGLFNISIYFLLLWWMWRFEISKTSKLLKDWLAYWLFLYYIILHSWTIIKPCIPGKLFVAVMPGSLTVYIFFFDLNVIFSIRRFPCGSFSSAWECISVTLASIGLNRV